MKITIAEVLAALRSVPGYGAARVFARDLVECASGVVEVRWLQAEGADPVDVSREIGGVPLQLMDASGGRAPILVRDAQRGEWVMYEGGLVEWLRRALLARATERLASEGDAGRLPERLPQAYVRHDGGVRIPARALAHLALAEGGGVVFVPVEGQPGEVLLLSDARVLERLGAVEEEEEEEP